ncbi:ABC transporter permease subunit [Actinopolymorpha pittospori]|uniref:ABC-type transport system involved in multi-copper enzyme maturation permease subunit n=1 Tax=Actinopolymorpha pittospori TaxID=648752 RepID=A0A927MRI1_9ACTN|nr:ABC transporter permease subunit [Actinopolymorpha pittospori]MBE1604927.1 ABC-type transport system involved in multi-copper enzyme maturation permease subunit [Actinopolymorpha pittospori]
MITSVRAELFRLARWPVTWVIAGTWVVLNLAFGYLFNYLAYRSEDGRGLAATSAGDAPAELLLTQLLPERAPVVLVQGLPMFGSALILIFAALAVGGGYAWGTWKTVFTTGPGRLTVWGGTVGAIGVALAAILLLTLALDLATALTVAALESQPVTWPGVPNLLEGFGSALLISAMWATAGVLLGTVARGPALAAGLGLVWVLVVENLLRGVAGLLGSIATVTDVLPGTAAGSLAGALGALAEGEADGTPGVLTTLDGATATALLGGYLLAFLVLSAALTRRRDVMA